MQDLTSKFSQLYEGFLVMPVEYQVVVSAGLLIALAALKNIWSMLYPVRLATASLLRSVAFVIHPRKKKVRVSVAKKVVDNEVPRTGFFPRSAPPAFELDTVEKFYAVVEYYGDTGNSEELKALSYPQLQLLKKAADASPITTEDDCLKGKGTNGFKKLKRIINKYKVIKNERDRRDLDAEMFSVEAKHYAGKVVEPKDIPLSTDSTAAEAFTPPFTYTFQTSTTTPIEDDVL